MNYQLYPEKKEELYDGERGGCTAEPLSEMRKVALVGLTALTLSLAAGCIPPPGTPGWDPGLYHGPILYLFQLHIQDPHHFIIIDFKNL